MQKPWTISRRTFLRSAGAAIGLPMLDAMLPSVAKAAEAGMPPPRRLIAFFVPNGINMAQWTPAQEGEGFSITPALTELAPLAGDILVLSGLSNRSGESTIPGDHARGTGSFLTCRPPFLTEGANIQAGISMDQVAAQAIGRATPFPSLELGTDGGGSTGNCDSGYSCAYTRNISWSSASTPLAKETSPRVVFERLFSGSDPNATREERAKRQLDQRSILDFVTDDASRLRAKLGKTDTRKIDEYLTGIRELELRLMQLEQGADRMCTAVSPGEPPSLEARSKAMLDLMVLALRCDLTRVISFMLGNGASLTSFGFIGVPEAHHEISHHMGNPDALAKLTRINQWEVGQLAYLLTALKAVQEPDGSLLDNSVVFFSSEIEDGNTHAHRNLPVIVAGRGGNAIRPGRHIRYAGERPIADLFISLLATVGVSVSTFGADGTGPLPNLR